MPSQGDDRQELALKLAATVMAVVVFAALGAGVLLLRSGMPPEPDRAHAVRDAAADAFHLPAPPHTVLLHREATDVAVLYDYRSHLSAEGLRAFYVTELTRLGWRTGAVAPHDQRRGAAGALYFTDGRRHCIIVTGEDDFATHLTMIVSR